MVLVDSCLVTLRLHSNGNNHISLMLHFSPLSEMLLHQIVICYWFLNSIKINKTICVIFVFVFWKAGGVFVSNSCSLKHWVSSPWLNNLSKGIFTFFTFALLMWLYRGMSDLHWKYNSRLIKGIVHSKMKIVIDYSPSCRSGV